MTSFSTDFGRETRGALAAGVGLALLCAACGGTGSVSDAESGLLSESESDGVDYLGFRLLNRASAR